MGRQRGDCAFRSISLLGVIDAGMSRFNRRIDYAEDCLDDHLPTNHMLRGIDRHLELDGLRTQLKPFYGATERPLAVPELIMRMLIIGYSVGLGSERRLLP